MRLHASRSGASEVTSNSLLQNFLQPRWQNVTLFSSGIERVHLDKVELRMTVLSDLV
jgi:hypothetical protein